LCLGGRAYNDVSLQGCPLAFRMQQVTHPGAIQAATTRVSTPLGFRTKLLHHHPVWLLVAFWEALGSSLEACNNRGNLSGKLLGANLHLRACGGLRKPLGVSGSRWKPSGSFWEPFGSFGEPLGVPWGASGSLLGAFGEPLGAFRSLSKLV
jgi:hypothetical protein